MSPSELIAFSTITKDCCYVDSSLFFSSLFLLTVFHVMGQLESRLFFFFLCVLDYTRSDCRCCEHAVKIRRIIVCDAGCKTSPRDFYKTASGAGALLDIEHSTS